MAMPFSFASAENVVADDLGIDRVSQLTPEQLEQLKEDSLEGDSTVGHDQASAKKHLQQWEQRFGSLIDKPAFIRRPWENEKGEKFFSFFIDIPFKDKRVSLKSSGSGALINELMTLSLSEAKTRVMSLLMDGTLQVAFFLKDRAAAQKRSGSQVTDRGGVKGSWQFFTPADQESEEMDLSGLFSAPSPNQVNANP